MVMPRKLAEVAGIDGWHKVSDYGMKTMSETADLHQRRVARDDAKLARKIERNQQRRNETKTELDNWLDQLKNWSPASGKYATERRNYHGGWNWNRNGHRRRHYDGGGSYNSHRFTKDSRDAWKDRTVISAQYVQRAINSCHAMKKLEKEAEKLGLEPMYGPGELDAMEVDLKTYYQNLVNQYDRRGR